MDETTINNHGLKVLASAHTFLGDAHYDELHLEHDISDGADSPE